MIMGEHVAYEHLYLCADWIREKWKWEDVRARDNIQGHISVTTFQLLPNNLFKF